MSGSRIKKAYSKKIDNNATIRSSSSPKQLKTLTNNLINLSISISKSKESSNRTKSSRSTKS
jgi:hypothetical protein